MDVQFKTLKVMLAVALVLLAAFCALALLPEGRPGAQPLILCQKEIDDIESIRVQNRTDTYDVTRREGGFVLADIPADVINLDYFEMLLREASDVSYLEAVAENAANLADYGLDNPAATVDVKYKDGETLRLAIGAENFGREANVRYVMANNDGNVLLFKENRTIRFTMPLEKYIDFVIVDAPVSPNLMSAVGDVSLSGKMIPEPIEIKAVRTDDPEMMRKLITFGAATHLITKPRLHEADPAACQALFGSLTGLLAQGVAAYNCTPETIASYGLDDPDLAVTFDYANGTEAPERITLRAARQGDKWRLIQNDIPVVYEIAEEDFLAVNYPSLVLRFFASPLLLDVGEVTVETPEQSFRVRLFGDDNKSFAAETDEGPLDPELFRKFYTLLGSAAHDGTAAEDSDKGALLMTITYAYKDKLKPDDVITLYEGTSRQAVVSFNGAVEFGMRRKFVETVEASVDALLKNRDFQTEW